MKKVELLMLTILMVASYHLSAQVAINADGSEPNPSAMLDIKSTNKGLLIPRMTQAEIIGITSPVNGLQVFNTDDGKIYIFILASNVWKEVQYGTGVINGPASYTIGTGGSCTNTTVNGTYDEGWALDGSNTVTIDVNVTTTGSWSIYSDTLNGYSFSGTGTFTTTGTVQVNLNGTGTPVTAQTDNFTATENNNSSTCTFTVNVEVGPINYGGQTYATVHIGSQYWMAENLNIGTMIITDDSLQTNNGIIEKYCMNNEADSCDTFGGLYEWDEMMQYVTTNGTQGICPPGWHVPTDADLKVLEGTVDSQYGVGDPEWDNQSWRGFDAGKSLKSESGWYNNGNGTNLFGFNVLPAGSFHDGIFDDGLYYGKCWSSTEYNAQTAWWHETSYDQDKVYRDDNGSKDMGFPVRCVRD